jgi:cobalt/nickel transport system permease protein
VIVITAVLVLQCLVFADGGLTALGANVFLMALVAPFTAAAVMAAVRRVAGDGWRARLLGASFGAWCSLMATSLVCAGQLAMSGVVAWHVAASAMAGVHALIGLGEAAITALVLSGVARLDPALVLGPERERRAVAPSRGARLGWGLVFSLGLALFVAPFASPWPDGLERVAETLGFAHRAAAAPLRSPLADYAVPGWSGGVSVAAAGAVGVLGAFAVTWALAAALAPRARRPEGSGHA